MNISPLLSGTKKVAKYIWDHRETVLLIAVIVLVYFLIHKPSPKPPQIVDDPLTLKQLKEARDVNNQLYVTIKQQVLALDQMGHLTDSLAKALKIKPKFIQGATIVKTVIDTQYIDTGSVKLVVIGGDTAHLVQHVDPWTVIKAYAYLNPKNWHLDHIDFKLTDSLYFIQIHKNPLFGRATDEVIVRSANPNNHITAGSSFKIKEKVPWLAIGAGGGYQLLPNTTWSIGIYAVYPIITLKR